MVLVAVVVSLTVGAGVAWAYVSQVYLNTYQSAGQFVVANTGNVVVRVYNDASGAIGSGSCVEYKYSSGGTYRQKCGSGYLYLGYSNIAVRAQCTIFSSGGTIRCATTKP